MKELLASGRVIDLALFVIAFELVVLLVLSRRGRSVPSTSAPRPLQPADLVGQLLAGCFLLVAIRLSLAGSDYRWILLALTASFPAHLFDVARRLRQARLT